MAELLRMPEVSADADSARLADWLVTEDQRYACGDPIATIETDKAVVDLAAESAGVMLRLLVAPGADVAVGEPLAVIAEPGERVDDLDELVGRLLGAGVPPAPPTPAAAPGGAERAPAAATSEGEVSLPAARTFISPLARRLARDHGLRPDTMTGTGPGGRIVRRDVERALEEQSASSTAPGPVGYTEIPHTRSRRAIARRLTESIQTAPHFSLRATARMAALVDLRRELNGPPALDISFNDLFLKAAAVAHVENPAMNVVWTDDAVRRYVGVDLGMAIATEEGLVTPVVRGVETLTLRGLARITRDVTERARRGRLRQEELEGGTATVTNLGMFGTEAFSAIINPPQASILAVGAVRTEPVAGDDGALRAEPVVHLTLSVDHRPIDGAIAARWLRSLVRVLEDPRRWLA